MARTQGVIEHSAHDRRRGARPGSGVDCASIAAFRAHFPKPRHGTSERHLRKDNSVCYAHRSARARNSLILAYSDTDHTDVSPLTCILCIALAEVALMSSRASRIHEVSMVFHHDVAHRHEWQCSCADLQRICVPQECP